MLNDYEQEPDIYCDAEITNEKMDYATEYAEYCRREQEEAEKKKPKIVFKYLSAQDGELVERIKNIFEKTSIFLPTFQKLNDPLEGCNSVWHGDPQKRKDELAKHGVLCFSADGLLSTQWAHYAANYKGVAIGFWTDKTFSPIQPIKYISRQEAYHFSADPVFLEDCFKKREEWKPEQEWRMLFSPTEKEAKGDWFQFEPSDFACLLIGENVCACAEKYILTKVPKRVPIFHVRADSRKLLLYAERQGIYAYSTEEILKTLKKEKT